MAELAELPEVCSFTVKCGVEQKGEIELEQGQK